MRVAPTELTTVAAAQENMRKETIGQQPRDWNATNNKKQSKKTKQETHRVGSAAAAILGADSV
jgi:hypothetical protein